MCQIHADCFLKHRSPTSPLLQHRSFYSFSTEAYLFTALKDGQGRTPFRCSWTESIWEICDAHFKFECKANMLNPGLFWDMGLYFVWCPRTGKKHVGQQCKCLSNVNDCYCLWKINLVFHVKDHYCFVYKTSNLNEKLNIDYSTEFPSLCLLNAR